MSADRSMCMHALWDEPAVLTYTANVSLQWEHMYMFYCSLHQCTVPMYSSMYCTYVLIRVLYLCTHPCTVPMYSSVYCTYVLIHVLYLCTHPCTVPMYSSMYCTYVHSYHTGKKWRIARRLALFDLLAFSTNSLPNSPDCFEPDPKGLLTSFVRLFCSICLDVVHAVPVVAVRIAPALKVVFCVRTVSRTG